MWNTELLLLVLALSENSVPRNPLTYHHVPHTKKGHVLGRYHVHQQVWDKDFALSWDQTSPVEPGSWTSTNLGLKIGAPRIDSLGFCHQSGYFLWLSPHFKNTYYSYVVKTSVNKHPAAFAKNTVRLQGCTCKQVFNHQTGPIFQTKTPSKTEKVAHPRHPKSPTTESLGQAWYLGISNGSNGCSLGLSVKHLLACHCLHLQL